MRSPVGIVLSAVLLASPLLAARRGENLLRDPSFEGSGAWGAFGEGFTVDRTTAHSGEASIRCATDLPGTALGAAQVLTFDAPLRGPIRVSGWSRAENAVIGQDYSVYLDVLHEDGSPLWGQIAAFRGGTHDWERSEFRFTPQKPVRRIEVYVILRRATGAVWFDDIDVSLVPLAFEEARLTPEVWGTGSFAFRARGSLPLAWEATLSRDGVEEARWSGTDPAVRLAHAGEPGGTRILHLVARDDDLGEQIAESFPLPEPRGNAASRDLALWTEDSMVRVLPTAIPPESPGREVRLSLARGERESAQIVLLPRPGLPVSGMAVSPSDLVRSDGRATIPASRVDVKQVGYVTLPDAYRHPLTPEAGPGLWPDPLLPVSRFDLAGGFAQAVWLTVHATRDTAPGIYRGSVRGEAESGQSFTVPIEVRVFSYELPVEGHLPTAFALMDGYLEKLYGKPLDPAIRRAYGDFVLEHRLDPCDISRTEPPDVGDLAHWDKLGMTSYNAMNLVEERGERTWVCWSPAEVYTPEFRERLVERLDPWFAQARAAGVARKAYIYSFDERGDDFFPILTEYFGLVKERYPEVHALTTAYVPLEPEAMRRLNVDWNCPLTARYDMAAADRCRAEGQQVWAYVCLGPRYPYANWLVEHPLIESRVLWWQAFEQKMDGFLYWGLNIWDRAHNDAPIDPAKGPILDWSISTGGEYAWLNGDGELLYAGKDGPIGSIRLANIRDGLEDYEHLWLLAQKRASRDAARAACAPVTSGLTEFTRDPAVIRETRDRIARELEG